MNFSTVDNRELSITLTAPGYESGKCFSGSLSGYDAGTVEITVASGGVSNWQLVKSFASEIWCTVKCSLKFLFRRIRHVVQNIRMLWKIAASYIVPARRIYAFRL